MAAFTAVGIWTGFILVTRYSERGTLLPTDLAALRFFAAGLVMLPWLWAYRRRMPSLPRMVVLALCGGLGYAGFAYHGFAFAPAAHAAVLLPGMMPFLVALVAMALLGERPSRQRTIGLGIIGAGMLCVAVEGIAPGLGLGQTWRGDALFVAASLSWSIFTVLLRRWQVQPWDAVAITASVSAVLYLPLYLTVLPRQLLEAPLSEIALQGVYQGFLAVIVAMVLFARAVAGIGPTRMGVLMALVPVAASLLAVPVLGEPLTWLAASGVVLASSGAILAARAQGR
ncbi:DMT family transporter [Algiphilus sp.]|uniref:DMT family transporter n=1 Tax=Algiphilus sp. TaxID=1872431 RepID=UPI003CCC2F0F